MEDPAPGVLTLSQVCELTRNKQKAALFSNPLGKACYELDQDREVSPSIRPSNKLAPSGQDRVKACLDELDECQLLEAGLVYASEVRSTDRPLNSKEWRMFQAEIGCQPLHLACLACGRAVERLQKEGAFEKAKATQSLAGDVVKLLAEYGAQLDLVDVGPVEGTPLHLAARFGAAKLLSTLLTLGADASVVDGDGCTAALVAQRSGQVLCQETLGPTFGARPAGPAACRERGFGRLAADAILQVVLAEEQREMDLLEGPVGERARQRWKERKGLKPGNSAADDTGCALEGERPRRITGTKYAQGLWAALNLDQHGSRSRSSSRCSTVHSDDSERCGAERGAEDPDLQLRRSVLKLRARKARRQDELAMAQEERREALEESEHLETLDYDPVERAMVARGRWTAWLASTRAMPNWPTRSPARGNFGRLGCPLQWTYPGPPDGPTVPPPLPKEKRANELEQQVAQRLAERKAMREAMSEEIYRLERELRFHQRRVQGESQNGTLECQSFTAIASIYLEKHTPQILRPLSATPQPGLEEYWEQFYEADCAVEVVDFLMAEQRCRYLESDLAKLTKGLDLPLFETSSRTLAAPWRLAAVAAVHRAVHALRSSHKDRLNEMTEFCNSQLAEKEHQLSMAIEASLQELAQRSTDPVSWGKLARMIDLTRERLERESAKTAEDRIWEGLRTYDPEVELETEKHWQQLKTEKPQLFDGAVWCLQRYALEGEGESQTLLLEMQEMGNKDTS
eukprot:g21654.t1